MAKKEMPVKVYKDVNESWCGSAYFINKTLRRSYCVTVAAGRGVKKNVATGYIKEELARAVEDMKTRHPDWVRVTKEECDEFDRLFRETNI